MKKWKILRLFGIVFLIFMVIYLLNKTYKVACIDNSLNKKNKHKGSKLLLENFVLERTILEDHHSSYTKITKHKDYISIIYKIDNNLFEKKIRSEEESKILYGIVNYIDFLTLPDSKGYTTTEPTKEFTLSFNENNNKKQKKVIIANERKLMAKNSSVGYRIYFLDCYINDLVYLTFGSKIHKIQKSFW